MKDDKKTTENMKKLGLKVDSEQVVKMKKNIEIWAEQMPLILEGQKLAAIQKKGEYDNYVKAGFTPEQALELIKK